jgi:hypothetical protein
VRSLRIGDGGHAWVIMVMASAISAMAASWLPASRFCIAWASTALVCVSLVCPPPIP